MTNPGLNISDERSSAEMLGLLSEQLHLWIVPISGPLDPSWVAANEVILSEEERGDLIAFLESLTDEGVDPGLLRAPE